MSLNLPVLYFRPSIALLLNKLSYKMSRAQFGEYDSELFREVGMTSGSPPRVLVEIIAANDLTIDTDAVLAIYVPESFPETCIDIKTETPELFQGNPLLEGENSIVIPWLTVRKYPIAVWLYAIRNSLKRPDVCLWSTPMCLRSKFSMKMLDTRAVTLMAGASRLQGRRPYMEDVDFGFDEIRISDKSRVSLFGVLDGHGGAECSKFIAEEVPSNVILNMRGGKLRPGEALFQAYMEADKTYLDSTSSRSGSTATVLLWDHHGRVISVANSGDTRAVLCRAGLALDITRDKKASDLEEIARVCEEGGFVVNGRVQGSLAVARSLGDRNLKVDNRRYVIPDPEITQFRLHPEDEFIIMATDGLWDVLSSQAAVSMATSLLQEENIFKIGGEALFSTGAKVGWTEAGNEVLSKLKVVSDKLAKHAHSIGSCDNITDQEYETGTYQKTSVSRSKQLALPTRAGYKQPPTDSGPLSPGALSSEILSALRGGRADDQKLSSALTIGRADAKSSSVGKTDERKAQAKIPSAEDDDLMSFLLDDNNF